MTMPKFLLVLGLAYFSGVAVGAVLALGVRVMVLAGNWIISSL